MENVDLESSNVRTLGCAAGISILAGLIYLLTAARDIVVGDSPELITAAATLGVAHPPGYPLFTMLGHLFSLLPVGTIPFRVNLLSVVCDSLAVGIIFLTGFHLSRSRLAAATAALVLALNPLFWSWSLVTEVFPLNNLLASLLIYLLVIWQETPERAGSLIGASFVAGLAFSNHQTIVLLGPAVCFVLWQRRAVFVARPQILLICAGLFLVGLLPYLYVPWAASRHPAYNWGNISSLRDVGALIMRQSYGGYHLVRTSYRGGSSLLRIVALFFSIGALMGLLAVSRADPCVAAPPMVFLVHSARVYLHRAAIRCHHKSQPGQSALGFVRAGTLLYFAPGGDGPADRAGHNSDCQIHRRQHVPIAHSISAAGSGSCGSRPGCRSRHKSPANRSKP